MRERKHLARWREDWTRVAIGVEMVLHGEDGSKGQMGLTSPGNEVVRKRRRYRLGAGNSRNGVESMARELESHLRDAAGDGRDPRSVIGDSLAAFASAWAAELRPAGRRMPGRTAVERKLALRSTSRRWLGYRGRTHRYRQS